MAACNPNGSTAMNNDAIFDNPLLFPRDGVAQPPPIAAANVVRRRVPRVLHASAVVPRRIAAARRGERVAAEERATLAQLAPQWSDQLNAEQIAALATSRMTRLVPLTDEKIAIDFRGFTEELGDFLGQTSEDRILTGCSGTRLSLSLFLSLSLSLPLR